MFLDSNRWEMWLFSLPIIMLMWAHSDDDMPRILSKNMGKIPWRLDIEKKKWVLGLVKCILFLGFEMPKFRKATGWNSPWSGLIHSSNKREAYFIPCDDKSEVHTSTLPLNLYKPLDIKENWQTTLKRPLKPNACSENGNCILSVFFPKPGY